MKLTIHGVRGSVPTPSRKVVRYGGNTSCYEITTDCFQLFFDTGTGFSNAGILRDTKEVYVFYSHFHHDHIQGLAFNPGIFESGKPVTLTSGLACKKTLKETLQKYFSGSYFPIDIFKALAHLKTIDIGDVIERLRGTIAIDCIDLNHPGGAVGYSVSSKRKKVVILLDNEFTELQKDELLKFCKDTDLLIWDGMFTDGELTKKQGWGHSSIEEAVRFSKLSKIKRTLVCHHAPDRTDQQIDVIKTTLASEFVAFGYEKMVIDV
jgi:phosphoribosyl 1,2-cyclic phosphodiesterase